MKICAFSPPLAVRAGVRGPQKAPASAAGGPEESVSLSGATATSWSAGLRKCVTGLMMGLSLLGAAGLAACHSSNPTPVSPTEISAPAKPLVYRSTSEVEAATRNSVTADQLKPGEHRFTAFGVDSEQSSKNYHQPDSTRQDKEHVGARTQDSELFQQCLATSEATGACKLSKSNQISHVTLSCLYQDELDGQTYRVVHKSLEHFYTKAMDRMVCGGHRLQRGEGEFGSYMPSQTDAAGNQLYLNPANVIAILPAN